MIHVLQLLYCKLLDRLAVRKYLYGNQASLGVGGSYLTNLPYVVVEVYGNSETLLLEVNFKEPVLCENWKCIVQNCFVFSSDLTYHCPIYT